MATMKRAGTNVGRAFTGKPLGRLPGSEYDQLEEDAFRAIEETEAMFVSASKSAFGDRSDPLRTYGEAFVKSGAAHLRALRALNAVRSARSRAITESATDFDYVDTSVPPFQQTGPRSRSRSVSQESSKGIFGWFAGTFSIALAVGVVIGHWHADGTDAAVARLTNLRSEAIAASSALAQAKAGMSNVGSLLSDALGSSQTGLSIIHRLSTLPQTQRAALEDILSDLALRPTPVSLSIIRDLLRLSPQDRQIAVSFAQLGDSEFRTEFLPVSRLAALHAAYVFIPDERNYPGCVTNGPVLRASNGATIRTCLIEVPQSWAEPDTILRHIYKGE